MALSMQEKSSSRKHELVRNSLEYFGINPDDRAARMRAYGKLAAMATLTATAIGAGAVYLKGIALIW